MLFYMNFPTTNNEAKYKGMAIDLNLAKALRGRKLIIFSDSQLVVM